MITAHRNVEGVIEMMLDATQHFNEPLNDERLFNWHATLPVNLIYNGSTLPGELINTGSKVDRAILLKSYFLFDSRF